MNNRYLIEIVSFSRFSLIEVSEVRESFGPAERCETDFHFQEGRQ